MSQSNSNITGNLLLVKIGTEPKLEPVVDNLRMFLPNVRLLGIQTENKLTRHLYDEVVADSADTILASYPEYFSKGLAIEPRIFKHLTRYEGALLRSTETTVIHDLTSVNHPPPPIPKFRDSYDDRLQLVFRHLAYWDYVFQKYEVSAVVSQNYGHNPFGLAIESVALARSIPTLFFHEVRPFLGSLFLCEDVSDLGKPSLGASLISEAKKLGWYSPDSELRVTGLRSQAFPKTPTMSTNSKQANFRLKKYFTSGRYVTSNHSHFIEKLTRSIRVRIRTWKSRRDERRVATDELPEKYLFTELQSQPNGTTLRKGWMYPDQREAIATIAAKLPLGYKLVVRESPRQWSRRYPRRRNYWSVIGSLPNVVVVDSKVDISQLISGAAAIIETSYSTLSYETLFLFKPVLILGETHLRGILGVVASEDFENIEAALEKVFSYVENPPKNIEFIQSVDRFIELIKDSTLEGALSSTPKFEPNFSDYISRVTQNVAACIAVWYLSQIKKSVKE